MSDYPDDQRRADELHRERVELRYAKSLSEFKPPAEPQPVFTVDELASAAANVSSPRLKAMLQQAAGRARAVQAFRDCFADGKLHHRGRGAPLRILDNFLSAEGLA